MMTYEKFKAGPRRRIMAALDPIFLEALDMAASYSWFRKAIIMLNSVDDRGSFVKAARRYAGVCSPGERELLKGILLLTDFAHVADEISAGEAYGNMTRCGGPFRVGLAACVLCRMVIRTAIVRITGHRLWVNPADLRVSR